jgi:Fe-S cluster assembly iron-binding protein IscA
MLELTPIAVEAVKGIVSASEELSDDGGVRIVAQTSVQDEPPQLGLELASEPDAEDVVVEQEGARVFLEAAAAEYLDDKTLDAEVDESNRVGFKILASL